MSSNISSKKILWGFLSLVSLSMTMTIMKSRELMDHHVVHVVAKDSIGNIPIKAMKSIDPERLEHERMFTDTLKNCMPGTEQNGNENKTKKKCKTFVPEGSKERIAIMAPPGTMDASLLQFIRIVLMKGEKGDEIAATQVEVIPATNMAPYGYGKTHGYTRVVRIVPQPLLLGATNTLKAALQSSSSSLSLNDITLNDLKAAMRQQIRYHCRLNHIAAHTAMWTIGIEDFSEVEMPWLVETAQSFFGLDMEQDDLFHKVNSEYEGGAFDEDKSNQGDKEEEDTNRLAALNDMYSEGSKLMSLLQTKVNAKNAANDMLRILDDVLLDEMQISSNLTAWPCESFWTVGEPGHRLEISPIISSISRAMSPNCTAPYTSCFVKKDECEARGDGECK